MKNFEFALEDKTYRLEETLDALDGSMKNLTSLIKQQKNLLSLVEKYDDKKEFEEFIKESNEQLKNLQEQSAKLAIKYGLLSQVVEACKKDTETSKVTSMLMTAFGIFEK